MTNPGIEFIPNQRIAYIRRTGAYGPENYQTVDLLTRDSIYHSQSLLKTRLDRNSMHQFHRVLQ